jgi:hypothetical protein
VQRHVAIFELLNVLQKVLFACVVVLCVQRYITENVFVQKHSLLLSYSKLTLLRLADSELDKLQTARCACLNTFVANNEQVRYNVYGFDIVARN